MSRQQNSFTGKIKCNRKLLENNIELWKQQLTLNNQRKMLKTEEGRKKTNEIKQQRAEKHLIRIRAVKDSYEKVI